MLAMDRVLNNKIDNQAREITALQVENNAMKSEMASLQLRLDSVSKMTGPIGPVGPMGPPGEKGPKGERGLDFQLCSGVELTLQLSQLCRN